MQEAFFKALLEVGLADPRLCVVAGGSNCSYLDRLSTALSEQVWKIDSSDAAMLGVATGLALQGKVPVLYWESRLPLYRTLAQIRGDICRRRLNVKIVTLPGPEPFPEDVAMVRGFSGFHVMLPSDARETHVLTESMVTKINGPCYLRLDNVAVDPKHRTDPIDVVPFLPRVVREGKSAVIFGAGSILEEAFGAAELLAAEGISIRIVSLHGIRPLATHSLGALTADVSAVLTLEEHVVEGGIGSAIAEWMLESGTRTSVFHRFGVRAGPRESQGLDASSIAEQIRFFFGALRAG